MSHGHDAVRFLFQSDEAWQAEFKAALDKRFADNNRDQQRGSQTLSRQPAFQIERGHRAS